METTIKINNIADLNLKLLNKLIKDIVLSVGRIEITIKTRPMYKPELIKLKEDIENGAELYSFSSEEFDSLNENLLNGEIINKSLLKKVRKDEKGNFVSV